MRIRTEFVSQPSSAGTLFQREMEARHIPGGTLALLRGGQVCCCKAFGVKDNTGTPMSEDVLFESASLTKSLFGTLVMRLCQEGRVELDRPIVDVLRDEPWSNDPRFSNITPRHCLCHGSGLPNWQARPMDMLFDPGSAYSYSGEGYFLLQRMVEQIMGQDLNQLLHGYFLDRLGMTHSTATWTPAVGQAFSLGFGGDGSIVKIRDRRRTAGNAPEPCAAWSLYSNSFDMIKFLAYIVRDHGGLEDEVFREMTTPQNRTGEPVPWGLGWGLCRAEPHVLWHWGDNDGFKSLSILDGETGDGLCVYTNSDNGFLFWVELGKQLTEGLFFDDICSFVRQAE